MMEEYNYAWVLSSTEKKERKMKDTTLYVLYKYIQC
jgi:hypothetical protein